MNPILELFSRRARFIPRTQAQALAALGEGIVEEGVYVWKAVNVHPVLEEPWDEYEIERLLAKADLDLETTLVLMRIFRRMSRDPDKERALFAAESVNAVELRHARRIQDLRRAAEGDDAPEAWRGLALALRDFGIICGDRPVLRDFYLREALAAADAALARVAGGAPGAAGPGTGDAGVPHLALGIEILIGLGEAGQAADRLAAALAARPGNPDLILLEARLRFLRRDYRAILRVLEAAAGTEAEAAANPDFCAARDFWTGAACRD